MCVVPCEVLMVLPSWRSLLTKEQDDSEKQQLMGGRKTCTSHKDDSAASQGEGGWHGHENWDRCTLVLSDL